MILYQLVARGPYKYISGIGSVSSTRVFATRGGATDFIPDFTKMVTTPNSGNDFSYLDKDGVEVTISKLYLQG